ncbi:NaeI family type II restriction endonuclease [Paraburkholderia caribensis]|uniref:NaeI family type II restriction endonuclease n=1 Tax=Paraburkholderia caribensis TaxID=75105 RepID=UPI001591EB18|nr:NaeI family type II restriction endonuclease [Paraburkholderia caribensis]
MTQDHLFPTEDTLVVADSDQPTDLPLNEVLRFFQSRTDFIALLGLALRQSFDEVIDGPRTGRFSIDQLEKTEKTYIGTKVEIVVRNELELARGVKLDNSICGHEVDTKFSLTGGWMIPREAVGELCLLIAGSDASGTYSAGLLRTTPNALTVGANQDGKRSVSALGKREIHWITKDSPLPRNFMLDLAPETRAAVLSPSSGKQRIIALFMNVTGRLIPRSVIVQVAQLKGDPLRRARETKAPLLRAGIEVLCATYAADREKIREHGFTDFSDDDWLSVRI